MKILKLNFKKKLKKKISES